MVDACKKGTEVANPTGAERLIQLLKFVEFTFPGQVYHVRVFDYKMRIEIRGVGRSMVDLIAKKHLVPGMYIESKPDVAYIHANLIELNSGLCGYLDVRRCWGLTKIEHWITELESFLSIDLRGKDVT